MIRQLQANIQVLKDCNISKHYQDKGQELLMQYHSCEEVPIGLQLDIIELTQLTTKAVHFLNDQAIFRDQAGKVAL